MGVTLDGIAKGYVVDRMAAVLAERGLRDFLINAGGDIRSGGVREDGTAWRVGVQDPAKRGDLPDVIGLTNGAVATSGSYEIYFDRERVHHHIVSAHTGNSPQMSQSVSVVAPTTMAADALATSVFLMEPARGVAFIDSLPQCACLIVDEQGLQSRSKGWRSATDLSHPRQG
jgi:thiamine biosynthesis lipoprotein